MASATSYDNRFYDRIRHGCQASAAAVVPVVMGRLNNQDTSSLVDVGCGEGWWAQAFNDAGFLTTVGIDSGERREQAPDVTFIDHDLRDRLPVGERFDLAACLEVAEHLPADRAESFVADLCGLADTVLFSAAMPRQGGTGHINCQPPAYWADLFAGHCYACDGSLRWVIWDDPDVEPWYKSNLLLFTKGTDTPTGGARPLHVIHPDLWLAKR